MTATSRIDELCDALSAPAARIKYASAKALRAIAARSPDALYPRFDFFVRLLDGDNRVLRWNAARILGNLAVADRQGKLDKIFDRFFAPIPGPELIGAANVIQAAADIALAKPHLAGRIATEILKVSRARYATPECRNVAIGHAIESLHRFFPHIQDQQTVLAFVQAQLTNPRPAARKKAEKFLKKWSAATEA